MSFQKSFIENILQNITREDFSLLSLQLFKYQYDNNPVYRKYVDMLGKRTEDIKTIEQIPFLPIEFFKTQKIVTGNDIVTHVFESSGTTGYIASKHYVTNISVYEKSFAKAFRLFYGNVKEFCILALLPSYMERGNSSLVYMMNKLIEENTHPYSSFYSDNVQELAVKLKELNEKKTKTILIGVSYALLGLAEKYPMDISNVIIMETGGMKGKRKELVREELHDHLCKAFNVAAIHSEYGMTELFSQAYSKGNGFFVCPPWMKVIIRDVNDPLVIQGYNATGGINIIDLANINSCAFIATQDLGRLHSDGSFEVLGRFDNSDVRGCNLLAG